MPLDSGGLYTLNKWDISDVDELGSLWERASGAGEGISEVFILSEESIPRAARFEW